MHTSQTVYFAYFCTFRPSQVLAAMITRLEWKILITHILLFKGHLCTLHVLIFYQLEVFVIFCVFLLLYFWYIFYWEALWWKLFKQCLSINQKSCGENDVNFISVMLFEGVCQEVHLWVKACNFVFAWSSIIDLFLKAINSKSKLCC